MAKEILDNPLKKNLAGILIISVCFTLISLIVKNNKRPTLELSPQDTTIHFNEHFVKGLSFGQQRLVSSLLWSETLLRAGISHYKEGDLNNWIYRRLNLITTLDPYFYQAYLYGGMYLSVVKDDDIGAKHIYERGLKYFPDDIYLCLNAGFHYHFELFDYPNAIKVYKRIVDHHLAPSHLPSLLARLQSEEGDLMDAFNTLESVSKTIPKDTVLGQRFQKQLYSIRAELDLKCLNSQNDQCNKMDLEGNPYLFSGGEWKAQKEWQPYRIKKRAPKKEP